MIFFAGSLIFTDLAFGCDRLVAFWTEMKSSEIIIAFPKNNSGRDVMIDAPTTIYEEQLNELNLKTAIEKYLSFKKRLVKFNIDKAFLVDKIYFTDKRHSPDSSQVARSFVVCCSGIGVGKTIKRGLQADSGK